MQRIVHKTTKYHSARIVTTFEEVLSTNFYKFYKYYFLMIELYNLTILIETRDHALLLTYS